MVHPATITTIIISLTPPPPCPPPTRSRLILLHTHELLHAHTLTCTHTHARTHTLTHSLLHTHTPPSIAHITRALISGPAVFDLQRLSLAVLHHSSPAMPKKHPAMPMQRLPCCHHTQKRYEPGRPARPRASGLAVLLYPKHALNPSPNPVQRDALQAEV